MPVGPDLRSWLVDQAARADPVGDVARALYPDLMITGVGTGYDELVDLLVERRASPALTLALEQAHAEWSGDLRLVTPPPARGRPRGDRGLGGLP